jgi:hypothetical protein
VRRLHGVTCLGAPCAELATNRSPTTLDLDDLRLADVAAIRFLAAAERQGVVLQHCAPFVREWMARETE